MKFANIPFNQGHGRILKIPVEGLPKNLFDMANATSSGNNAIVLLPPRYSPNKTYPLFVYLKGGCGAQGAMKDAGVLRRLAKNQHWISVSLPLFKKPLDANEIHQGIMISAMDDIPVISKCMKAMIKAVDKVIPNTDPHLSSFGGFSNGGHTTAVLLSSVAPFLLKRFQNFFLLDGGFHIASLHKTALHKKNIRYWIGGSRTPAYRRALLAQMKATEENAKMRGCNLSVRRMPEVGHAFPDEYIPELQAWINAMNQS